MIKVLDISSPAKMIKSLDRYLTLSERVHKIFSKRRKKYVFHVEEW